MYFVRSQKIEEKGYYIKQFPWTPTQRRGYIDAEFESPGPAAIALRPTIGLVTSEGTMANQPSFTFGSRRDMKVDRTKPGPADYVVDDVTYTGKFWAPAAMMGPKLNDPEPFKTPAPGAYNPERAISAVKPNLPVYTIGEKRAEPEPYKTPAPGAYNPDKSMNATKQNFPNYSIGEKHPEPRMIPTPAPSDYESEKVWMTKVNEPKFTFGVKHSKFAHSW
ncbi:Outer dense fiber protein 3 [Halotydeus destructor]|nr:Outer dense fiber protein 3 [Halotydeus destructor]